jgi:hypothetical protein
MKQKLKSPKNLMRFKKGLIRLPKSRLMKKDYNKNYKYCHKKLRLLLQELIKNIENQNYLRI